MTLKVWKGKRVLVLRAIARTNLQGEALHSSFLGTEVVGWECNQHARLRAAGKRKQHARLRAYLFHNDMLLEWVGSAGQIMLQLLVW